MGYPLTITTPAAVRAEVERAYPGLVPFELNNAALRRLDAALRAGHDARLLRHLVQQSALSEGLAAVRRGESADYLREVRTWH